jgi:hypothetical protein
MKLLDFHVKEISPEDIPQEAKWGRLSGIIGNYTLQKGEKTPNESQPIILFNTDMKFLALAYYRKNEKIEAENKIEYLINLNYNPEGLNPQLSQRDYFISILSEMVRRDDGKEED